MALQNIGASNRDDAFYRYKMPKMITKIEGRGNGIKTNIVNMVDIAKALARPASYTTKYFGCELGAQSKFDEKTGTSLVNGAHDTAKLAALLENFIKKYVQCYGCGNPETEVVITKLQMIHLKCAACGYVSEVDMRDKLTTFIVKNPPELKKGSKDNKAMRRAEKERFKEGEAVDEEQRKLKKESKKKAQTVKDVSSKASAARKKVNVSDEEHSSPPGSQSQAGDHEADGDDGDGVQWQTDTSAEAARQRINEQLNAVTAEMVMLSTSDKEPQKKQKSKTGAGNGNQVAGHKQNGRNRLFLEMKDFLKKGSTPAQLAPFYSSLNANPQEAMTALVEALFEGVGKGFAKEVGKKKLYLAAVIKDCASQMLLLHAIESFCEKCGPDVTKEIALVTKVLYDEDVLEEEVIMQWYKEGIAGDKICGQIRKNVKPFVEWLETAESESDDEE